MVRIAFVVCLFAAAAPASKEETIRELVETLHSDDYAARQTAHERLAKYGESIHPLLRQIQVRDPDVARLLRGLTRASRRLRLDIALVDKTATLGMPLRLDVRLVNDSDDTYLIPLMRRHRRSREVMSGLSLLLYREGKRDPDVVRLPVKSVEQITPSPEKKDRVPGEVFLRPGELLRVRVTVTGARSPLRKPGKSRIGALFEASVIHRWYGFREQTREPGETMALAVRTTALPIHARSRTVAQLIAAMSGRDPYVRDAAIAELTVREDAAVRPVLRRFAHERELRLIAIERLGKGAADEDFRFIYDMTRSDDAGQRRAAVTALANFKRRKARSRLISLAQDHELKAEAIRALGKHKHYATIDCFVRLLVAGETARDLSARMRDTLYEWTGMIVNDNRREIRAFERWWGEHRTQWRKANASR